MPILIQFVLGLIFGLGLVISGMSDPAKVLGFLDLAAIPAGTWDPSLAFVLIGANAVGVLGFRFVLGRAGPLSGDRFHLPSASGIDSRLLSGAAIFGVGWGLSGFCPGPALTALGFGAPLAVLFAAAMLTGMIAARWLAMRTPEVYLASSDI